MMIMEGRRRLSLFNCVPSFAQGTDILLVHNDTLCLRYLSSLLRQCSFTVTATNQASAAIDMVCEQEGRFKLVMAKANMPEMSTISFLNALLLKHITVIFISCGHNDGGAKAAFERGSCYLLQEPIHSEDLISLWQQIYNSNHSSFFPQEIIIHSAKSTQKVHESSQNQERTHHDARVKRKVQLDDNDLFPQKMPRVSWTPDLHHKFMQAIRFLREHNVHPTPSLIQGIMNVPYLTCRHVASHLQKFKSEVMRLQDKSSGTKSSSSIQSQCYPGYPTSAAFQDKSQSQNHFPVNFSETEGLKNFQMQENFSCRHQAELINYGNEDLEAVVRGAVPGALMDKNRYDDFGNGFTEDGYPTLAAVQDESRSQNHFPVNLSETEGLGNFQMQENQGCASFSCQYQAELVNYENEDLEAVVRGAVSDALMDKNHYDNFGNGFTEDDGAQNPEIQMNPIFGNSYSPQNSTILGEIEPCPSMNQSQTLIEDIGVDSEGNDYYILGYHTSDSCNPSSTEHDSVLRFLGEGYDCLGKGQCSQNAEMQRNSVLGYNFDLQNSDSCNPSCVRLLKNQNQNPTSMECNDISIFLQEDCDTSLNSEMLRNSVSGNSSSSLHSDYCNTESARSCSVVGNEPSSDDVLRILGDNDSDAYGCFGNEPSSDDVLRILGDNDSDAYGCFGNEPSSDDVLRILGDNDSDPYGCFGNEPSSDDIAMLKHAIFGDCSSP